MLAILGSVLALYLPPQGPPPAQQGQSRNKVAVRDSTDTASTNSRHHRAAIRNPVTAEVLQTAFKDPTARATLTHARAARLTQDSALVAYDAMSYQRISAGMGFSAIGRDRLLFRHESA